MAVIIACCGHKLDNIGKGVALALKDISGELEKCISRGLYCQKCADFYREDGCVLEDKKAEEEWLI